MSINRENVNEKPGTDVFLGNNENFTIKVFTWALK